MVALLSIYERDVALIWAQIGLLQHEIYRARQNMREVLMCRKWHSSSERRSFSTQTSPIQLYTIYISVVMRLV